VHFKVGKEISESLFGFEVELRVLAQGVPTLIDARKNCKDTPGTSSTCSEQKLGIHFGRLIAVRGTLEGTSVLSCSHAAPRINQIDYALMDRSEGCDWIDIKSVKSLSFIQDGDRARLNLAPRITRPCTWVNRVCPLKAVNSVRARRQITK
jgi:hypothetical protein